MMDGGAPSETSRRLKIRVTMGSYSIMAGLSLAWGFLRDRPDIWFHPDPMFDLPWQVSSSLGLGSGIALGIGISALSIWLVGRARWAKGVMQELGTLLGGLSMREVILVAAFSSVGEELFFRGVLEPGVGLILSSLAFGLLHVPTSRRMIPWTIQAIAMGFLLGFLFLFTGDLTICVATHFVVNARNLRHIQRWATEIT